MLFNHAFSEAFALFFKFRTFETPKRVQIKHAMPTPQCIAFVLWHEWSRHPPMIIKGFWLFGIYHWERLIVLFIDDVVERRACQCLVFNDTQKEGEQRTFGAKCISRAVGVEVV